MFVGLLCLEQMSDQVLAAEKSSAYDSGCRAAMALSKFWRSREDLITREIFEHYSIRSTEMAPGLAN